MVFSLRPYNIINATLAYNNSPLPIVDSTLYLGITIDSKLIWKEHIIKLLADIGPRLNFLKMISSTRWGGDPKIITTLYKSIVRSKLDYGSSLYGSASHSLLQKLDVFQNTCLRLIIGALKSTPTSALCAETGIPPLHFRRNYITDRILARTISNQLSTTYHNTKFILSQWRFSEKKLPLLCQRAKFIFRLEPYIISAPSYCLSSLTYRQTLQTISIYKFLDSANNKSSSLQLSFDSYINNFFPNSTQIFTDGSKNDLGVGSAFWIPSLSFSSSFSLPSFSSIFLAEQMAILHSLNYIKNNFSNGTFLIISDSLSALQSISTLPSYAKNTLALSIIALYNFLTQLKFHINFLWIPSHSDIRNNDLADYHAKAARTSPNSIKLITSSELFSLIRRSSIDDWSQHYPFSFNNPVSHYLAVQPTLPSRPWYEHVNNINRSVIIKLSRLRFGHNRLPPHMKRINLSPTDTCPLHTDSPAVADLDHIFFHCPSLSKLRRSLFAELTKSITNSTFNSLDFISSKNIDIFPLICEFISHLPDSLTI